MLLETFTLENGLNLVITDAIGSKDLGLSYFTRFFIVTPMTVDCKDSKVGPMK